MEIVQIFIAIGGIMAGIVWGFNLHIIITKRKIRRGETPKWLVKSGS